MSASPFPFRDSGPAEAWYCECADYGWDGQNRVPTHVLRTPIVRECPVCHAVAPWTERVEAE